jgi:putative redox protein
MSARIAGLTAELEHGPSGARLKTVPPKDNGGTGESFSPTDLVGAALVSCALSTMALGAGRESLSWGDASGTVEKHMSPPPRRIAELTVVLQMPREVKPEHRARLEELARNCPVARSLHPDVKLPMQFKY